MNKLREILINNPGLKFLSLLLAAALWFLVTNLDDPTVTVRFYNIPVTIRNTSQITDQGKIYEVLDGTDVISSVAVVAPRSVADTFTRDNIIATADMNNLSSLDTLSINLTTNKYMTQVVSITGSIDTVRLSIEESKTRTLALTAVTTGTLPDGYIISSVKPEQNVLRITGPASAVDSVATASVSVDVTGFTSDIDTDAEITLYDSEGHEVDAENISRNINDVRVTVSILQTKRVPVSATITGTPADGWLFTGEVDISPESVLLAGKGSTLQNLEELVLIDDGLTVNGATGDLESVFNIRSALPSGVSLADSDFNGQISVTAHVEEMVVRELEIPETQVSVENIPEGMRVTIQTADHDEDGVGSGMIPVSVRGLEATVNGIAARDISGTIDVNELLQSLGVEKLEAGAYTVSVSLALPQGVYPAGTVKARIYIEEEQG